MFRSNWAARKISDLSMTAPCHGFNSVAPAQRTWSWLVGSLLVSDDSLLDKPPKSAPVECILTFTMATARRARPGSPALRAGEGTRWIAAPAMPPVPRPSRRRLLWTGTAAPRRAPRARFFLPAALPGQGQSRPGLLAPAIHAFPSPALRFPDAPATRPLSSGRAPDDGARVPPRGRGVGAPSPRKALPTSSSATRCPSPGPARRAGRSGPAAAAPRTCSAAPSSDALQAVHGLRHCHLPAISSPCVGGGILLHNAFTRLFPLRLVSMPLLPNQRKRTI